MALRSGGRHMAPGCQACRLQPADPQNLGVVWEG